MSKKWKLSESGLQIYEGSKHIATVHYGGNPIVDVSESIANAKIINHAPEMKEQLAALRAENEALRDALIELKFQAERRHDEHQLREGLIDDAIKQARAALKVSNAQAD